MAKQTTHCYAFGPFRIDPSERVLRNGEIVPLAPKAFEILLTLVENSGRVVQKEELLNRIWPSAFVEEANLNVNMSILRKVLGDNPRKHQYIETIPKRGYRFVAPVSELAEARTGPNSGSFVPYQPVSKSEQPLKAGGNVSSIAVLPFKPLGADDRDEFLGLGLADTLITRLTSLRQAMVSPTSAVRKFAALEQDPLAAGRALGVEAVLDGSFQRLNGKIRVTVRFLRVEDGAPLWAGQFDEEFTSIFSLQDVITKKLAKILASRVGGEEVIERFTPGLKSKRPNEPRALEAD